MREHDWAGARATAHSMGASIAGPSHLVPLHLAGGRILATDVKTKYPIPHCATSAMDGYAVSGPGPWKLRVANATNPGVGDTTTLSSGEASAVVTGSLIPGGTSAILRSEHARHEGALLLADRELSPGADIRPAGGEAGIGELLAPAGTQLRAGVIAVAAVAGYDELSISALPAVHLVFTGDEVITSGHPAPGQVRDGFSPVLPRVIGALGGRTGSTVRIGDTLEETIEAINGPAARTASLIVTTGGTGFSERDFVRAAVREVGGETLISSIAMRPGHPSMLASLPGGRLLVALPGNPLAALMAAATLIDPILRGACGRPLARLRTAVCGTDFAPLPGRYRLLPAFWLPDAKGNGPDALVAAEYVAPAMLRGLAVADAILVVGPEGVKAGSTVQWLRLPW